MISNDSLFLKDHIYFLMRMWTLKNFVFVKNLPFLIYMRKKTTVDAAHFTAIIIIKLEQTKDINLPEKNLHGVRPLDPSELRQPQEVMGSAHGDGNSGTKGHSEEGRISHIVSAIVSRAKALHSAASSLSGRIKVEEQALSQRAVALERDMKTLRSDVYSALEREHISHKLAEKLEEDIDRAHWMIYEGDVGALLPHKYNGLFLRMLLGPVNVKATRNDVRFKVKEEYNAYRDRTSFLYLLFPSILLSLKNWLWGGCFPALPVQAYEAWLLFFYTSLALRENILRINGSDIRPWWVYHHYCAMLMAVVALTWDIKGEHPHCEKKQDGIRFFLVWAVVQGVSMLLQNRYQRQRLYTRIALGKAGRMDVVWGETAGVVGQLCLLYPLLFLLQVSFLEILNVDFQHKCHICIQFCQGSLGFLLLLSATKESQWQVIACGILLLIMALGNFANTIETLFAKMRIKTKKSLAQKQPLMSQ